MTSTRSSKTTDTCKAAILRYLDAHPEYWTPKIIAQKLKLNYNTVRCACLKLSKAGIIVRFKPGLTVHYKSKTYFPAKNYRTQPNENNPMPLIHGLQIHIKGVDQEGEVPSLTNCSLRIRDDWEYNRTIHYQFSKKQNSLTVWLNSTRNPLKWDDFKQFLSYIHGLTGVDTWKRLDDWTINNIGHNIDGFLLEESPDNSVKRCTLSHFSGLFAQWYKKEDEFKKRVGSSKSRDVYRAEVHEAPQMALERFMGLMTGGMLNVDLMNLVGFQNNKIDQQNKKIDKLEKLFSSYLRFQLEKEHKKELKKKKASRKKKKKDSDKGSASAAPPGGT